MNLSELYKLTKRDVIVCSVLIVGFLYMSISGFWNHWSEDFSAYYYASYFYGLGQFDQVYAGPAQIIGPEMPTAWLAAVAEMGHEGEQTYPFIYPPWSAAILTPIALNTDPLVAMNVFLVINCAIILACVFLARRVMNAQSIPVWYWWMISLVLLVTNSTSISALALGQVQIFVFFLCLLAFERYLAKAFWFAGALLALAACIKITPAALAIIFLWDRNWKALGAFTLTATVIGVAGLLAIGLPLHVQYLGLMEALNKQVFLAPIGFSIEGFVYEINSLFRGLSPAHTTVEYSYPKAQWIDLLAKSLLVAGLFAIWATTNRLGQRQRLARQLLGLSLLIPLVAPLGWVHYFLLTTILLPGMFVYLKRWQSNFILVAYFLILNIITQIVLHIPNLKVFPQMMATIPVLVLVFISLTYWGRQKNIALDDNKVFSSNAATRPLQPAGQGI